MKFEIEASVHFVYFVESSDEESAVALLKKALGENWEDKIGEPTEIAHSKIETGSMSISVGSLGPVRKVVKRKRAA